MNTAPMTQRDAARAARTLWDTGDARRGRNGAYLLGPVRSDGRFAAVYVGRSWQDAVRRAYTRATYDHMGDWDAFHVRKP